MAGTGDGAATDSFATTPPLPAIPGFVLRHLRMPDDISPMNAIANAVRRSQGDDFYTTVEQMQQFYESPPGSDPARDVAIAEVDGQIVGYGRAAWHEEPDGPRIYEVIPFVDPTVAGEDVFVAMVDALEARLRTIAADHSAGDKLFETFGGDSAPEREALLEGIGYQPIRHGYAMLRSSVDDLPDAPLPAGVEIREVQPEHLPAIWAADQEAFSDAWGFAPATEGDYQRFLTDPVMSDTSLWRIAWDGDEVAGQVRAYISAEENERFGRKRGYTEHISVRRPWRRRGLARALIAASFPLLRARGMTEVGIGVDTENVSGALSVYENCGFRPISRSTTYRRPLA
ncbi:MAG TPA: GNAT family N-acetyltransferase [Methylomirabilota bacterium]|jgi:GNAT superfamily N-acetyltransferase|nr:GNAT family N-acetyltransferase [Methylomirabilota bacterium]